MNRFSKFILSCFLCAAFSTACAETVYVESDFPEAAGKKITFCGGIVQTIKKRLPFSGEVIFLNFERPYPSTKVSLLIPHNAIQKFGNYRRFKGKRVCVRGVFYAYDREDHKGKIYNLTISSPADLH